MSDNASLIKYNNTGDILQDMRGIIEVARESAYQAVNVALVQAELAPRSKDRGGGAARREPRRIWA